MGGKKVREERMWEDRERKERGRRGKGSGEEKENIAKFQKQQTL